MKRAWLLASGLLFSGCGDSGRASRDGSGVALAVGDVTVSTVNGVGIGARELERLAHTGKLTPREALLRLQAARLLEAEARSRGYGHNTEARGVVRQAMVQALLRRDVEAGQIPERDLEKAYAAAHQRFQLPEKRVASHVLALVPSGASAAQDRAARELAVEACKKLAAATDVRDALVSFKELDSPELRVRVEDLPAVANDGTFVPEFTRALFSAAKPGVIPEPVRTQYGWHAIVLTAIQPAVSVPLAEARVELERELTLERNKRRTTELLSRLAGRDPTHYSEHVQDLLAQLDF